MLACPERAWVWMKAASVKTTRVRVVSFVVWILCCLIGLMLLASGDSTLDEDRVFILSHFPRKSEFSW